MGSVISCTRPEVVPTLHEDHLAMIQDQGNDNTCVSMAIGYMAYVFLMKYYAAKTLKQIFKKDSTTEKEDIQKALLQYLVDLFHPNQDASLPVLTARIPKMCKIVAKAFGCKCVEGNHTQFSDLPKFLKLPNTIHCCLFVAAGGANLYKFASFFQSPQKRDTLLTVTLQGQEPEPAQTSNVSHAMVLIDAFVQKDTNLKVLHGANSWGEENFGNKGYFKCQYECFTILPKIFTYKKTGKAPTQFVLKKENGETYRTINAEDLIGNTVHIRLPWGFTIGQLKQAIANQVGVNKAHIDLLYRKKLLTDNMTDSDIAFNPFESFHVLYHSYDNSKQRVTLDGKNLVVPNIYNVHGANPLIHKIFANKHALAFMVHNPRKKTVSYYGPFYNVPDDFDCSQISEYLKKHHNLSFNFNGGVFFKTNPYSKSWLKINPTFALKHQIRYLKGSSYIVLNVQE